VDTIVLDKTGTVTTGRMTLAAITPATGQDEGELLRLAAAVEAASEHPIAQAIARAGADRSPLPPVTGFANLEGLGVTGTVDGRAVLVGRPQLLRERGYTVPAQIEQAVTDAQQAGQTAVVAGWDGIARGVLAVADPSSRPAGKPSPCCAGSASIRCCSPATTRLLPGLSPPRSVSTR
jgi:Cu+-exporting ATPase